jgi:hypothetical protein
MRVSLLGLVIDPEDDSLMFLWNTDLCSAHYEYMVLYLTR